MGTNFTRGSCDGVGCVNVYASYKGLISDDVITEIELSADYADHQSSVNRLFLTRIPDSHAVLARTAATTLKSDRDAKLRVSLDYMVTPTTLLYDTTGVAETPFKATSPCKGPIGSACFGAERKGAVSKTPFGWIAGVGIELALSDRVLARAEYRHTERAYFVHGHTSWKQTPMILHRPLATQQRVSREGQA